MWFMLAAGLCPLLEPVEPRNGDGGAAAAANSNFRYDSSIGLRMSVTLKGVVCGASCCCTWCLGLKDMARSAPFSSGRSPCSWLLSDASSAKPPLLPPRFDGLPTGRARVSARTALSHTALLRLGRVRRRESRTPAEAPIAPRAAPPHEGRCLEGEPIGKGHAYNSVAQRCAYHPRMPVS